MKKILVMRIGGLGDVLMSTPLVRNLRLHFHGAQLDYLVGNWAKIALKGNADIDNVITFDEQIFLKKRLGGFFTLVKKIKNMHYDMVLILDKHWIFGVFGFLTRIPVRIGFNRHGEGLFHTLAVPYSGKKYELDYNLDLLHKLKIPIQERSMIIATPNFSFAKRIIKKKTIVLIPGGATNPGHNMLSKRWPAECYVDLGRSLIKKKYAVIVMGSESDRSVCHYISEQIPGSQLNLNLQWEQQLGVMKKAKYVVTHDSGPMHIAAASGAKVIAIFGPTDPHRFAPKNAIILSKKPKHLICYDEYGHFDQRCDQWTSKVSVDDVMRNIR